MLTRSDAGDAPGDKGGAAALARLPRVRVNDILVLLTNRCNLLCEHCYTGSTRDGAFGLAAERVIALAEEAHALFGSIHFTLSGGEALSRNHDALDILAHVAELHHAKVITNGTLIGPRVAARLAAIGPDIKMSLDGASPQTHDAMRGQGSFERSMRGLDALADAGFPPDRVQIGSVLHYETMGEVAPLLDFARTRHYRFVRFDALNKIGRAAEVFGAYPGHQGDRDTRSFAAYFETGFMDRFGADWLLFDIDNFLPPTNALQVYYDGETYFYTPLDDVARSRESLGNILQASLKDIFDGERIRKEAFRAAYAHFRPHEKRARSFYAIRRDVPADVLQRALGLKHDLAARVMRGEAMGTATGQVSA